MTQTISRNEVTGELADLVDQYTSAEELPPTEWLSRHRLHRPLPTLKTLAPTTRCIKRAIDVTLAATALIVLAPVMLVIAALIKLTSAGPVVFKQMRVGLNSRVRHDRRTEASSEGKPPPGLPERRVAEDDRRNQHAFGKPFVLYKFRTMHQDAEKDGACFAVKEDPRVTAVGRFLRFTRLDEIPQFWNVLRGEMSLVGPRPERPEFIEDLSQQVPGYLHRLRLKPGVTGLAQVVNGYDNDVEGFRRKVAFDLLYLQNCSVWNDLKILAKTVGVVITGKGAL